MADLLRFKNRQNLLLGGAQLKEFYLELTKKELPANAKRQDKSATLLNIIKVGLRHVDERYIDTPASFSTKGSQEMISFYPTKKIKEQLDALVLKYEEKPSSLYRILFDIGIKEINKQSGETLKQNMTAKDTNNNITLNYKDLLSAYEVNRRIASFTFWLADHCYSILERPDRPDNVIVMDGERELYRFEQKHARQVPFQVKHLSTKPV